MGLKKTLKKLGFSPSSIARKLKISKQKVNYWLKAEIKTEIKRKTKLDEKEINMLVTIAENQTTSERGSRKLADMMNKKLKEQGKKKTVGKSTICTYLKKRNIKLRKFKRVFALNEVQKKKRLEYCQAILKKKSKEKIFFSQMKQK